MEERTNALPKTENELIENEKLRERIETLNSEIAQLQRDLAAYINLANEKDKWALELQRELAKNKRFSLTRIYAFAVRALKKIFRSVKNLLR